MKPLCNSFVNPSLVNLMLGATTALPYGEIYLTSSPLSPQLLLDESERKRRVAAVRDTVREALSLISEDALVSQDEQSSNHKGQTLMYATRPGSAGQ